MKRTLDGLSTAICHRSAPLAVLVAVLVSLGGCGDEDPDRPAAADPGSADLVGCGAGGPTFPRSALDTLHAAPAPDGDMAEAIEPFLASGEGDFWPQEGWRVLSATGLTAVLVADHDSQLWFQTLEQRGGQWVWSGSSATGECPLRIPPPVGFNTVEWRLDPDRAAPTPSSTEIDVLVLETECASGQAVGDRLVGPEVAVTATEVRVGFVAEAQDGDSTCQGNPETPVRIPLDGPLGERDVVDAFDLGEDLRAYL